MKIHQKYIFRGIQLGKNGLGNTAPNPMVGAVIVLHNKIIGEGYTSPYGGAHAEVNAIHSVSDKSLLKNATLYVTLEPCSHHGKTPPCSDLIIKHKIPEVVIGIKDPHDKVAGKGIKKLEAAGCKVTVSVLEKECREHHKRFLCFQEKKRPYIILKWAQTKDGFIAPDLSKRKDSPEPFWITNRQSRQLVHKWRTEEQAILVGTTTVLQDNPKLDARTWKGKNPIRVIIDKDLKTPKNYHILDGNITTIILTNVVDKKQYIKGVDYITIDFKKNIALQICEALYLKNITSIIIEGGCKTLQTFIDANVWDEARVFTGATHFKSGIKAPEFSGTLKSSNNIAKDTLNLYTND